MRISKFESRKGEVCALCSKLINQGKVIHLREQPRSASKYVCSTHSDPQIRRAFPERNPTRSITGKPRREMAKKFFAGPRNDHDIFDFFKAFDIKPRVSNYGELEMELLDFCRTDIATLKLHFQRAWRTAKFSIDDGRHFPGYTTGERWNGWATPSFELDVAKEVMEYFGSPESRVWWFDEARNLFVVVDEMYTPNFRDFGPQTPVDQLPQDIETFEGEFIKPLGKMLYDIGAWSWTWDEDDLEPKSEGE